MLAELKILGRTFTLKKKLPRKSKEFEDCGETAGKDLTYYDITLICVIAGCFAD